MEAIILAGGLGTRLRDVISDLPKPMAPINGRPFLEYLISNLKTHGFTRIILSIGYMGEKIEQYFGSEYDGIEIIYSRESEPLGTGGALRLALHFGSGDHVYVFNGDTYINLDFDGLEDAWKKDLTPIIVGKVVPDASRYGSLILNGSRVVGFSEKSVNGPGLINIGCYVLPINLLERLPKYRNFSFESDFLQTEVSHSIFNVFIENGYFIDIGIPEDYKKSLKELRSLK